MDVPSEIHKDVIVCFDVCQKFLVLGTTFGKILIWWFLQRVDDLKVVSGGLDQRIDKITIRHGLVIAVQNGLFSVLTTKHQDLAFLYCKSFENPDKRLLDCMFQDKTVTDKYLITDMMEREQFQMRYRPLNPAKFPDQDFTVSTTGRERFAAVRVGEQEVTVHNLSDGQLQQTIFIKKDLKVLKLAIVHFNQFSSLLYILTWQGVDKSHLLGKFYNMDTKQYTAHIQLYEYFDCNAGYFSLFTEHGLLMAGKSVEEMDPLQFLFICWNYSGDQLFSLPLYSEYGLCLAECKYGALITPRALNYFYQTEDKMMISQRTHRGACVLCFSWPGTSSRLWRINTVMEVCCARSNVLLAGSQAGGVVCTVPGARTITVRDERSGGKLWEESLQVDIENMWVGDSIIVTVPKTFKQGNTVCLIHVM